MSDGPPWLLVDCLTLRCLLHVHEAPKGLSANLCLSDNLAYMIKS